MRERGQPQPRHHGLDHLPPRPRGQEQRGQAEEVILRAGAGHQEGGAASAEADQAKHQGGQQTQGDAEREWGEQQGEEPQGEEAEQVGRRDEQDRGGQADTGETEEQSGDQPHLGGRDQAGVPSHQWPGDEAAPLQVSPHISCLTIMCL